MVRVFGRAQWVAFGIWVGLLFFQSASGSVTIAVRQTGVDEIAPQSLVRHFLDHSNPFRSVMPTVIHTSERQALVIILSDNQWIMRFTDSDGNEEHYYSLENKSGVARVKRVENKLTQPPGFRGEAVGLVLEGYEAELLEDEILSAHGRGFESPDPDDLYREASRRYLVRFSAAQLMKQKRLMMHSFVWGLAAGIVTIKALSSYHYPADHVGAVSAVMGAVAFKYFRPSLEHFERFRRSRFFTRIAVGAAIVATPSVCVGLFNAVMNK